MKEIGILFQPDMVRAIMAGRKTLTSRLRGLDKINGYYRDRISKVECRDSVWCFWEKGHGSSALPVFTARSPYGEVGDVLIGRETWGFCTDGGNDIHLRFAADNSCADIPSWHLEWAKKKVKRIGSKLAPSIHMPYWASRLRLPVIKTWPSRLQDMTEEMAIQEGCERIDPSRWGKSFRPLVEKIKDKSALAAYADLWDEINAKHTKDDPGHAWETNPWVWRVLFGANASK